MTADVAPLRNGHILEHMTERVGTTVLEQAWRSPEGRLLQGKVGPDDAPVRIYVPNEYTATAVTAIGLVTNEAMYDGVGRAALEHGQRMIVFGHDHRYHAYPIRANAQDIQAGLHDLRIDAITGIGHSMGTLALLLACEDPRVSEKVQGLVQVNPAMAGNHAFYRLDDYVHMGAEAKRLVCGNWRKAVEFAGTVVTEVVERPLVVANQVMRLLSGKVHHRYIELSERHPDMPVNIIFTTGDGLVPERWAAELQQALPTDRHRFYIYRSPAGLGHAAFNYDPVMAHGVLAMTQGLTPPEAFRLLPQQQVAA